MSEFAYALNGEPFEVPPTVTGWRVKRIKPKGAPEVVYGSDGSALTLPVDAGMDELRREAVVEGKYRLDPVGEDNRVIATLPAGYVYVHKPGAGGELAHAIATSAAANPLVEAMRLNTELARSVIDRFPVIVDSMSGLVRCVGGLDLPTRTLHTLFGSLLGSDASSDDEDTADEEPALVPPAATWAGLAEKFAPQAIAALRALIENGVIKVPGGVGALADCRLASAAGAREAAANAQARGPASGHISPAPARAGVRPSAESRTGARESERNNVDGLTEGARAIRHRTHYLLSGVLTCGECEGPMTIMGGSSCRYYACATRRTKGTCTNRTALKEPLVRARILEAIRSRLSSQEGVAQVRQMVVDHLRDYSKNLDGEIRDRRQRVARTEEKIRGLVDFIATGDRSEYVQSTLRDLESYVRAEKASIRQLEQAAQSPLKLPSIDDIVRTAYQVNDRLAQDPVAGRQQLLRWLKDGKLRVIRRDDGKTYAVGALLPLTLLQDAENENTAQQQGGEFGSVYDRRSGGRI